MNSPWSLWRRKSIWILLAAAVAIVLTGHSLMSVALMGAWPSVWTTFTLVVFVYGIDSLIDTLPPGAAFCSPTGLTLSTILLTGLASASLHHPLTLITALIIVVIGVAYNYPIQLERRVFRLKSITGLKSLLIGVGWGLLVYLGAGELSAPHLAIVAGFVTLQVTVGSVLRDLADIEEDQRMGVRTLPVVFGEQKTYAILHGLSLLSGGLIWLLPLPWSGWWVGVLLWRAANLEWLRWGKPGHWATQYMNLATCGMILLLRMVHYVLD